MMAGIPERLADKWRIAETAAWDKQHLYLCGPAYIEIDAQGRGDMAFGALEALQIALQDDARKSVVGNLVQALPYVATLLVLAFASKRHGAPEGLGKHATE